MVNNHSTPIIEQISECFIRSKHDKPKQPYYLTHTDLSFLPSHYLQKGLVLTKPPNFNIHAFLDKFKAALALALDHYYPLAGRFETVTCDVDENGEDVCGVYLDCNKGPGARFIHAACDVATVADIVASEPDVIPIIRAFFEVGEGYFINYDGHTRPLLCVQVTEIIDGLFIGFTMNHSVVDGATFWKFVNNLSKIYKSMDGVSQTESMILEEPIINPIFADGYGPIIKLPCSKLNEFITRCRVHVDPHIREKIFHFSTSSIARLKANANTECYEGSRDKISSFQSLSALIWRSITRARSLDLELITSCSIVADARVRFNPPLSSNHFGNLIFPIQVSSKVNELVENGLSWVAMLLNKAINNVDQKMVFNQTLFDTMIEPQNETSSIVGGQTAVVIGGSVRFNMYEADFNLGKAIAVRTGYSAKTDGKVTTNPASEGEGSVEVEISLPSQTMSALEQDQEFMSFVSFNL